MPYKIATFPLEIQFSKLDVLNPVSVSKRCNLASPIENALKSYISRCQSDSRAYPLQKLEMINIPYILISNPFHDKLHYLREYCVETLGARLHALQKI